MKKKKCLLWQYIAAENGSKITYRSVSEEVKRAQACTKQNHQKNQSASFGTPDKLTMTDDDDVSESEKMPKCKRCILSEVTEKQTCKASSSISNSSNSGLKKDSTVDR